MLFRSEETDLDSHGGYVRYLPKPFANQDLLDVADEMLMKDVRAEQLYRNRRAS